LKPVAHEVINDTCRWHHSAIKHGI